MAREKRCPTCGRLYFDETINFCLADGSFLQAPGDPQPTEASPHARRSSDAPTEILPTGQSDIPTEAFASERSTGANPELAATRPQEQSTRGTYNQAAQLGAPTAPRRGSSLRWLAVVMGVLLVGALGILLYATSGKRSSSSGSNTETGNLPKNSSSQSQAKTSSTPAATPQPTPTATPEYGTIRGSMSYPSEAIPGVMVACAENVDTRASVCSSKRKGWETSVSYALRVPPGKYYVYGLILPGDSSVGDMTGQRGYYTDYMRCGMKENCKSHQRILLEVKAGETLTGIMVGDF